ncbi:MAG: PAS domain-containing protein [Alphaproteobacteria bacterium]|nr:PAS domain-containing protein [Alphaproteobacteria bacterium]
MAKRNWLGSLRLDLRVAGIWLALLLAGLAGTFGILRFAETAYERDLRVWQDRLHLVADGRFTAVNAWLDANYDHLRELADNASLQLYLTELSRAGSDPEQSRALEASRGYLYNLLLATAGRTGFTARPLGPEVAANVRRVGVAGLALLDRNGNVLVATPGMPPLEGALAAALARVPAGGRGVLDLHLNAAGQPALGFVLPVFAVQGDPGPSAEVGRILGLRETGAAFQRLLEQPGLAEPSLETLLVREQGAAVEYLSALRDGTTAMKKRLARDTPDLAAAVLAAAPGGFALLRDYRDREVLATGRAFTGVPWTLVTKIDRDAAMADSDARSKRLITGFFLGLVLVLVAFVAVWRHGASRRAGAAARKYRELADRFERQKDFLHLVTDNQSDALYLVDEDNRYRFANQAAATAAGIAPKDMGGKTLASVLGPATARKIEGLNRHALKTGTAERALHRIEGAAGEGPRIFESVHVPMPATEDMGRSVLVVEKDMTATILAQERHEATLGQLVATLVALVDRRDPFAANHSGRVAEVARAIAGEMGLDDISIETAETAGKLMNLGKILVPEELLTRQGPLEEEEKRKVQKSLQASADLLEGIAFAGPVTATLRQLQEHWDGSGEPEGLAGEAILITARVVAVANAFVAMASPRAYREGIGFDQAIENLREGEGSRFDRKVVVALINHLENHGGRERWGNFAKLAG